MKTILIFITLLFLGLNSICQKTGTVTVNLRAFVTTMEVLTGGKDCLNYEADISVKYGEDQYASYRQKFKMSYKEGQKIPIKVDIYKLLDAKINSQATLSREYSEFKEQTIYEYRSTTLSKTWYHKYNQYGEPVTVDTMDYVRRWEECYLGDTLANGMVFETKHYQYKEICCKKEEVKSNASSFYLFFTYEEFKRGHPNYRKGKTYQERRVYTLTLP